MQNFKNVSSRIIKAIIFVDFKPAELKMCKEWIIVYYAKNPLNQKLERFRLRVPTINNKTERLKHAKRIVLSINEKLTAGWSPFFEESGKNYRSFETATTEFIKNLDKMVADDVLRPDTRRTYNSNCNLLQQFVKEKNTITFALEINRKFCVDYLDWIYLERASSPRTRNNHLGFLNAFCEFLLQRGALGENPSRGIARLKVNDKKRIAFDTGTKEAIGGYFKTLNNGFETLCKATYFCFIRNSELSKLKVHDIDLANSSIFVSKSISKNKKDEVVTIPENYLPMIKKHLQNSKPDDYIFSNNNFFCGSEHLTSKKISESWNKLRKVLKLDSKYQFYGLKDSGIQDLLNSGIPALKVRNQARHSDIRITEIYTQRNNTIDQSIKTSKLDF